MNMIRMVGRDASAWWGWHVPRSLRLIEPGKVLIIYIGKKGVIETIHWLCLKSIPPQ